MYINADVMLYLCSKNGETEMHIGIPIEGVYQEDVRQPTYLKTGQREGTSVLLVIPAEGLAETIKLTQGKDLAVKDIAKDEVDCSSQEATPKSLVALKTAHRLLTVTTVDKRLYGSESVRHYELVCKQEVRL